MRFDPRLHNFPALPETPPPIEECVQTAADYIRQIANEDEVYLPQAVSVALAAVSAALGFAEVYEGKPLERRRFLVGLIEEMQRRHGDLPVQQPVEEDALLDAIEDASRDYNGDPVMIAAAVLGSLCARGHIAMAQGLAAVVRLQSRRTGG